MQMRVEKLADANDKKYEPGLDTDGTENEEEHMTHDRLYNCYNRKGYGWMICS